MGQMKIDPAADDFLTWPHILSIATFMKVAVTESPMNAAMNV